MPSVEELLENVLETSEQESEENVEPGNTGASSSSSKTASGGDDLDVAEFVESLGKTAESLEKAAERLPTTPGLASRQLRALNQPMGFTREDAHDQHRDFFGQALPQARNSLRVPQSLDAIQKSAEEKKGSEEGSSGKSQSWLLSQLGR